MNALVLQHQDDCPPGALADWAAARGVALTIARPDRGELPEVSADAVVVLGSDRSVNDDEPWIAAELAWLGDVINSAPVLGICFGAQALAVALGGSVARELPEIDWLTLAVDPALGCAAGPWLCWHNDFITPPADATVLARSGRAVHAFRCGAHLGVQFHPEVDTAIVETWMRADELGRDLARAGVDHAALRAATAEHAPRAAREAHALFDAFAARL
ncbi:MAG TPA: type 1 glutamine amidotransferase [Solirubrobacteraceae bacterium]